jgi:methyltransferase (TIGR00027 family)
VGAAAVERGVAQYVVLGAGLDTFAYRQPAWAHALRIVEVDHPASQAAKRERLEAAGIALPPNVTFAAIDLEEAAAVGERALTEALAVHGVRPDEPTFVSWLGVMMYLSAEAVDLVFRTVAAMPGGSELAFTFAPPPPPGVDPADWPSPGHRAATAGEPWRTFFTPEALRARLAGLGFRAVELLDPPAAARYFAGRRDGLAAPRDTTIATAVV